MLASSEQAMYISALIESGVTIIMTDPKPGDPNFAFIAEFPTPIRARIKRCPREGVDNLVAMHKAQGHPVMVIY